MASEQDTVAIPSEPPNHSQAKNLVHKSDDTNLESGCSNEQMETWEILNFPNGPPKDKQETNSIPQSYQSVKIIFVAEIEVIKK